MRANVKREARAVPGLAGSGVRGAGRATGQEWAAWVRAAALAMLFALLPVLLAAQSVTATIDGFVTDASGANVPNATVTVTEVATQIVHTTKSNATGAFTVPQLNPGLYDVAVTASGFSKAVRSSIELQVNQVASLTIPLAVGSAADTVQVSGQEPLLDIDNVSLGTVITGEEIADLPLNGRQLISLSFDMRLLFA